MNQVKLRGILKNIQPSHSVGDIEFNKANLLVIRNSGVEDVIDIKFKSLANKFKENDEVSLIGNIRSFSYTENDCKKSSLYVFTYFDEYEGNEPSNSVTFDGRICKMGDIRLSKGGKHNVHFIVANNILTDKLKINSYISCIAWGKLSKEISKLQVNDKVEIEGEIHSRECRKRSADGDFETHIVHEIFVKGFKLVTDENTLC